MPIVKCQRCSRKTFKIELCSYCHRATCLYCVKASKRIKIRSIDRLIICKDCWTNTETRKRYKRSEFDLITEFLL